MFNPSYMSSLSASECNACSACAACAACALCAACGVTAGLLVAGWAATDALVGTVHLVPDNPTGG